MWDYLGKGYLERPVLKRKEGFQRKKRSIAAFITYVSVLKPKKIDLQKAFEAQKYSSKQRNIPFYFTFEEWHDVWEKSGQLSKRGITGDSFCMARLGDKGAYETSNVKIITKSENSKEAQKNHPA